MFLLIPASLLLTVTTYVTIQGLLGYPTESIKKGKFILISSAVKEPDWVYYWVIYEGEEDPIAYKLPYTKPEHQKQEKANEQMKQGEVIAGEMTDIEMLDQDGKKSNKGNLEFYKFDYTRNRIQKGE